MNCPKCKSSNVIYQVKNDTRPSFWWGFSSKTQTYAVCQNCGKTWKRSVFEKPTERQTELGKTAILTDCNLAIVRESKTYGRDFKVKVFIDGKQAENLTNGSVQKYNLTGGTHRIVLKSFGKDDVVYDIDTNVRSYTISCTLTPREIVSTIV